MSLFGFLMASSVAGTMLALGGSGVNVLILCDCILLKCSCGMGCNSFFDCDVLFDCSFALWKIENSDDDCWAL